MMRKLRHNSITKAVTVALLLASAATVQAEQKTLDQLKQEAAGASGGQQAKLYSQIAERMVDVAAEQFAQGDSEKGHATVKEIVEYAGKARDLSVNTREKMKDVEIHLRETQRHLENVKRTLTADDRPPLDEAEKKIQTMRQELLDAMFAPKKKDGTK